MNNKHRKSMTISDGHALNMIEAAEFAYCKGWPLNHFVTVHLSTAGIATADAHAFITRLVKSAGDWLRTKAIPLACLWVLENPPGHGLNVHILFHVPLRLRRCFVLFERRWIRAAGAARKRRAVMSKPVGRRYRARDLAHYVRALAGLMKYLLKGADSGTCEELEIRHEPQGIIVGKRSGVSESIGWKARASEPQSGYWHRGNWRPLGSPPLICFADARWRAKAGRNHSARPIRAAPPARPLRQPSPINKVELRHVPRDENLRGSRK
jgi:hypothetical protein